MKKTSINVLVLKAHYNKNQFRLFKLVPFMENDSLSVFIFTLVRDICGYFCWHACRIEWIEYVEKRTGIHQNWSDLITAYRSGIVNFLFVLSAFQYGGIFGYVYAACLFCKRRKSKPSRIICLNAHLLCIPCNKVHGLCSSCALKQNIIIWWTKHWPLYFSFAFLLLCFQFLF